MLTRFGSKNRIAHKITPFIPYHRIYIEPFFGAGGIFFNKPLAEVNMMNDLDDEVFNLFMVIKENKEKFIKELSNTPLHESLLKFWAVNNEIEPIKKAVRFLIMSNSTLHLDGKTLGTSLTFPKMYFLSCIDALFLKIQNVKFFNKPYLSFLNSLSFRNRKDKEHIYIYNDPPYVGTVNKYNSGMWAEADLVNLVNKLNELSVRYSISELKSDFTMKICKDYKLNHIEIYNKRKAFTKNIQKEILIYNYKLPIRTLFKH